MARHSPGLDGRNTPQAGAAPTSASPGQHPHHLPRPRAICALCRLAGTANPQPLTSGRADCPQEPSDLGRLGRVHAWSAPLSPERPVLRRHAATQRPGAWRAPHQAPGRSPQETRFLKPLTSGGRGWAATGRSGESEAALDSRPPRWGGIAGFLQDCSATRRPGRGGDLHQGVLLCALLKGHLSLSIKP